MTQIQDNDKKIVKLKLDIIFKKIFGDEHHKEIITSFIADILEIPFESIKSVTINNVELMPEYIENKFGRLDLKLNVDGRIINVEMQVKNVSAFKDRTLFYWAKLFTEDLLSGEKYKKLNETICINILDFNLFDFEGYHSHFQVLEKDRHELLTDKFSIHFLELPKIKKYKQGKPIEEWLNLINAKKESDLMAIETTTKNPQIKEVIFKIRELSADEIFRELSFKHEKYLHDRASELDDATEKGIGIGRKEGREQREAEIVKAMKEQGFSEEQINKILGTVN